MFDHFVLSDTLRRELSKLRTGRAHPAMLDMLRVDYYGQPTPIAQMATDYRVGTSTILRTLPPHRRGDGNTNRG